MTGVTAPSAGVARTAAGASATRPGNRMSSPPSPGVSTTQVISDSSHAATSRWSPMKWKGWR